MSFRPEDVSLLGCSQRKFDEEEGGGGGDGDSDRGECGDGDDVYLRVCGNKYMILMLESLDERCN